MYIRSTYCSSYYYYVLFTIIIITIIVIIITIIIHLPNRMGHQQSQSFDGTYSIEYKTYE